MIDIFGTSCIIDLVIIPKPLQRLTPTGFNFINVFHQEVGRCFPFYRLVIARGLVALVTFFITRRYQIKASLGLHFLSANLLEN